MIILLLIRAILLVLGDKMMNIEFINYFYAGRIYQYFLDNQDNLQELGFLVPKKEGIDISKLKTLVKGLLNTKQVSVECNALPKRNGWRFVIKSLV